MISGMQTEEAITIRSLAARLAGSPSAVEAAAPEEYESQVEAGLAEAIVDIFDFDLPRLCRWFGACFARFGGEPGEGVRELLLLLQDEVDREILARDQGEEAEGRSCPGEAGHY